jgi:hypothetical protein
MGRRRHRHHHRSSSSSSTEIIRKHHHRHRSSSSSSSGFSCELEKAHDVYKVRRPHSSEIAYRQSCLSLYRDRGAPWCQKVLVARNRKHIYRVV